MCVQIINFQVKMSKNKVVRGILSFDKKASCRCTYSAPGASTLSYPRLPPVKLPWFPPQNATHLKHPPPHLTNPTSFLALLPPSPSGEGGATALSSVFFNAGGGCRVVFPNGAADRHGCPRFGRAPCRHRPTPRCSA